MGDFLESDFGLPIGIGVAAFLLITAIFLPILLSETLGDRQETERITVCVESGKQWVDGSCLNIREE